MSTRYQLPGIFHLQAANTAEFLRYWVAYRQVVEDFALDFTAQMADLQDNQHGYWVMRGEERIGGLIMSPNHLSHCFLIPPFADAHAMLSAVLPLLNRWSERNQALVAEHIAPHFVAVFQRMGFKITERHCWMIRPTAVLPYTLGSEWHITPPQPSDEPHLASLLYEAFHGGPGKYSERTLESHQESVSRFLADYDPHAEIGSASAVVSHQPSGQIAGVCLVCDHKGLPAIQFVAVHPDSQRQGLATALINRAIAELAPHAGWVKLALSAENPALHLYSRLGFVAATPLFTLRKKPGFRPTAVL